MPTHTEMVYLAVPRHQYREVISFIAELPDVQDSVAVEPTDATEPTRPDLDEALVRRIYDESLDTHRQLLKVLAAHAGEWVTYPNISKEMGFETPRSLPGTLGAFGRRAQHRYGGRWPFDARDQGQGWEARMEPWVAEVIHEL